MNLNDLFSNRQAQARTRFFSRYFLEPKKSFKNLWEVPQGVSPRPDPSPAKIELPDSDLRAES